MKVLVDTSVWSLALRRQSPDAEETYELRELILEKRACLIGPIRQELLSGIRETRHFEKLRNKLRAFRDLEILTEDFERAAYFSNACRRQGIQGSHIDFMICATAERARLSILTTDRDFALYARHIPVRLHLPRTDPS